MRIMRSQNPDRAGRSRRWLLGGGVVILLAAGFVIGWASFSLLGPRHDGEVAEQAEQEEEEERQLYISPMHPQHTSYDPDATCPICGMDMVPADEVDMGPDDLPVLELSERSVALLNIQVSRVERQNLARPVHFVGRLEYDQTRLRDVVPQAEVYVSRLHANYRWRPVERGEPLAEVYSPQVQAAAEELLVIKRNLRDDERDGRRLASAKGKLRRLGVSADQIERILETGQAPQTYQIRSPIDGYVARMGGREGHWLAEGRHLVQLVDLSNLWVELEAYERDLAWLSVGQPVELSVEAYPGQTVQGEVSFIPPHVDPQRRTKQIRIDVPNPHGRLAPGMFVRGTVQVSVERDGPRLVMAAEKMGVEAVEQPLVIPTTAPLRTGRRAVVYVKDPEAEEPTFEGREITLGPRAGDYFLVRDGLEEGELVVSHGAFRIDSELQIRGRPSMMSPDGFGEPATGPQAVEIPDDHPAHEVTPDQVPDQLAEGVAKVFEHYLALVAALAADDLDGAVQALEAYHEHLVDIDAAQLPEAIHEPWHAVAEELEPIVHGMLEGQELEDIRLHLEAFSEYTALAVQAFASETVGPVHRIHCPMAFDDRGADWLQDSEQVANPYFGQEMLNCGVLEEPVIGDDEAESAQRPVEPSDEHEVDESLAREIGQALERYFTLADAMADDDLDAARQAVAAHREHLLAMEARDLQDDAEERWQALKRDVDEALEAMAETEDVEGLRHHLVALSEAMEKLAVAFGGEHVGPLYRMHCPMARDNQGADWLQNRQTLNNPYMGQAMLACGSLEETLFD